MARITQDTIDHLLGIRKIVLDNIELSYVSRKKQKMEFKVNVLSDDDEMMQFRGYYAANMNKLSLTLLYKTYALITLHHGHHDNPRGMDPESVEDWHKQEFSELYDRDYAYNVSDEFNLNMNPGIIVELFMLEINLEYASGKKYIPKLLIDFT